MTAARFLAAFVAALHLGFFVLESFLWTSPIGLKVFRQTPEAAEATRVLAANQGLYNAFLAAGLLWGLLSPAAGVPVLTFFLTCAAVAGLFGAATASASILFVQALPALLALAVLRWTAA